MYNDSLQATIDANTLAINALKTQLETVHESVKDQDAIIQNNFEKFVLTNDIIASMPEKMYSTLKTNLGDGSICLTWKDYSNPERTNSIDINYRSNNNYENRNTDNHSWEISCSSNRLVAHSTKTGWLKQDGEDIDKAKLQLIVFEFISHNTTELIKFHNSINENLNRQYTIQGAISNLERGIKDAEAQMKHNRLVRLFKPGGETAIIKINQDIIPSKRTGFYHTRRNYIGFDVIQLLKERNGKIKTDFINIQKDEEGKEIQRWVTESKWMTLSSLMNIFSSAEEEFIKDEARRIEREKRELESHLDNASKQTVNA